MLCFWGSQLEENILKMLVSAYRSATGHRAVEDGDLRVITHLDLLFGGQQIGTAMATTDLEQQECDVVIKDAKPAAM